MNQDQKTIDISSRKVVTMRDVQDAVAAGAHRVVTAGNCVITPSARDFLQQRNISLVSNGTAKGAACAVPAPKSSSNGTAAKGVSASNPRLFSTPEAEAIKREICDVGRKLWMRQFVDGNGGNISYRIGPNEVLCTPTLVSKFDLTPEDLCLVDLEGNQIAGVKPRTSEIFLHLEIYKAVPEAKAAVHCHPPHATAYAITGRVPPNLVIPEFEVFVGKVAISPYETPGTAEFARTVLPYVKQHNTVLLSNHGIVCWADTVTHAEWYAEVLDTYCWTLMLASQLGAPISHMSEKQGSDLLAIKKRLGLPDVRFDTSRMQECQLSDLEIPGSIALTPMSCDGPTSSPAEKDLEKLVKSVTDAVMQEIGTR
ncbi:MAG TPA: class II aldolase/adducin family protein [Terracidiphilus sp.]|nr:class II aldolase/adducin family protein [Terracidiphilus sp.]